MMLTCCQEFPKEVLGSLLFVCHINDLPEYLLGPPVCYTGPSNHNKTILNSRRDKTAGAIWTFSTFTAECEDSFINQLKNNLSIGVKNMRN